MSYLLLILEVPISDDISINLVKAIVQLNTTNFNTTESIAVI
jgi:hypothetical protein